MLCEQCKVNRAEIHLVNVVNGERHVQHLCRDCAINALHLGDAASMMKMSFSIDGLADIEEALRELLMPHANEKKSSSQGGRHVCPNCGAVLPDSMFEGSDAQETDESASQKEEPPSTTHIMTVEEEIAALKSKMTAAVKREDYEYAAQLRDRIAELEKNDAAQDSDSK